MIIQQFFRHPIYMLKKCTPRKMKYRLTGIKNGTRGKLVDRRYMKKMDCDQEMGRMTLNLLPVLNEKVSVEQLEKIVFKKNEEPIVSIIIPVYNQFSYTYTCLKSVKEHTKNIAYEVILADDCSTDQTKNIRQVVENIVISRMNYNAGFLYNCNQASKIAKGEYILFLNNDTQVTEKWLDALVELAQHDDTIGMVGSKLVYPNGKLQEAGGIVWNDGSAWNYGRNCSPFEPEFNYLRETDYISGAAIMIRKNLWEKIGGFDVRFAPAYYEDTDLAFEVRKQGFKVVYQPLSCVVHFEGVSNGTTLLSGQKEFQIKNQIKFYKKWKKTLKKNHFPYAKNIFMAKDRSRYKEHVIIFNGIEKIPEIIEERCKVTYYDDDVLTREAIEQLNRRGVEVLYGNYYKKYIRRWLKVNKNSFKKIVN